MARARTKQELLDFGESEFLRLMSLVGELPLDALETTVVFENRTVKDLLSHLYDWQELLRAWQAEAADGKKPLMPKAGFTWREIPALNEALYQASKDLPVETVLANLQRSHRRVMAEIRDFPASTLETKQALPWTGSSTLASYYASVSSSHYNWASNLLKKALKTKPKLS